PGVRAVDDRELLEDAVQNAVVRIEDPHPQEGDDHARQQPREQEGTTKDGGSLEFVVQRQRQAETQTVGGCGGSDGEDEGLPQQLGEVTGEDVDDVGEADELTARVQQVLVEEGEAE